VTPQLIQRIETAIQKRAPFIQAPYETAFRLLNGFLEGVPDLVIEIFGKTVVYHDYSTDTQDEFDKKKRILISIIRKNLPWIASGIIKKRRSNDANERRGFDLFGSIIDKKIKENGVWYAIDLTMNRDASFYLDTRELRHWLQDNMSGKSVLNTFSYTGSIGIAALMGGASNVMHLDLNRTFLSIAKRSTLLNEKPVDKSQYQTGDFWSRVNQYKKNGKLFDCVILDPPVYAKTRKGTIDIAKKYDKIINKVRPLIHDGGFLVTINNALFQSGKAHQDELRKLCKDGYLEIKKIINVPEDCIGDSTAIQACLPADPSPYNHSTKITILGVKRKN